jgi:hypothetical protein
MKKILLILFISLFQNLIFGATITSTGTGGNWNATSSWIGGVIPTATDDVVISSGSTVTVTADAFAKSINVSGGELTINDSEILTVYGNIDISSTGQFNAGTGNSDSAIIKVYGNFTNLGTANFWKSTVIIAGNLSTASTILQNNGNIIVGGNVSGVIDGSGSGTVYPVNPNAVVVSTGSADEKPAGTKPTDPVLVALMNEVIYGGNCSFTVNNIANVSACSGQNAVFTVSTSGASSPAYQWQVNKNDGNGWIDLTNVAPYSTVTTSSLNITNVTTAMSNYQFRAEITASSCTKNGNPGILSVTPASVGGTVTGSTTVCAGTNSTVLTLSGYTGTIVRWESSLNNFATAGTTIANTTTTLTATNLSTTTSYRAVVQSGTCATANSVSATITTVSQAPATPGTITGTTPQCPALTAQIYSIGAVANANTYNWTVPTGWAITAGQGTTSVTVTTGNSSQSGNISVSATNGCGTSNAQYFYVAIDPVPSAPGTAGAYSPTCTGFTAQWGYTGYATKYFLDVSTNSGFSTFVSGYNNLDVGNVLNYTLAGLNPGTTYYYRVRAYSNCGTSSNSTTMNYATTASPTAPPVATAPDNIGCTAATLHWNSVTNATGYYIDIATDSGFTSFVAGYNNFSIGYANYYASGLPGGTLYYRIRATNSCGVTTASSNTISFTTTGPVGGTASSAQTICSGTSPASLTLTGNSSPVDHWERASDINFTTNYGYIGVNTSVLSGSTIGNLNQNTYFRAVTLQTSPSYCNGYSSVVLITVGSSISTASSTPTVCLNTAITPITHTTSGFTGIGTPTNLPAGVTASFASNAVTISGTPTASGTFNYTIPLTGGSCGTANATGTITVRALFTSGTISATGETICSNTIPTATIGSTTVASGGDTVITYQWQYSTDNTFATGITTVSNNTATYKPTQTLTQTTYYRRQAKDTSCNTTYTSSANIWTINVAFANTITLSSAAGTDSQTKCITTAITNITYSTTGAAGATFSGLPTGVNGSWSGNVVTISGTPTVSGTFNYTVNLTGGCGTVTKTGTIIVDILNAPSLGTITSPTCTMSTGSVVLTGLPSGSWTLNRYGASTATVTGTGSTTTISGLASGTYTFTVSNGTCTSDASLPLNITQTTNTWDGVKWSKTGNVTPPTSDDIIVFEGNYTSSGSLNGCSCTVNSGNVTINSGHTLTITNGVNVNGGTLTFENNASLLQTNNVINTGSIVYKRNSAPMKNFDYTYWSSPVAGQTLFDLSPNTLFDKYMSYSGTGWQISYGGTAVMQPGIGYIIRTPKLGAWPAPYPEVVSFPYSQPVQFKGVPNNGNITSAQSMIKDNFYLIGNPYPSALNADDFLYDNNAVLNGTIYLWTHNTAVTNLKYTSDDYASYNGLGGVATSGGAEPSGYIAAGQSFFASAKANGNVKFNNSMRAGGNNNAQFFKPGKTAKTASVEKHRLWLNMTNTAGAFKQALIGYAEGATNNFDDNFDGLTFDGNSYLDLYSINGTDNLTIQGRALPFSDTDIVPLGYRSTVAGSFTIAINKADGALANQRVYLEDKQTNTINDLTAQNYTFNTTVGTFNSRFVLRYTNKTLGTGDFETVENSVTVVSQDKTIVINSTTENLSGVFIYDISGKQLYKKQSVGNLELSIQHLPFAQQVLLVKVVLENGYTATKKLIFK